MNDPRFEQMARLLQQHKLNRRRMVQTAAAMAAVSVPMGSAVTTLSASAAPSRQSDPSTLVVLDNIQGGNWLYFDPGKIYEINPQAGEQLVYEALYHIPDGTKVGEVAPLLAEDFPVMSEDGLTATIKLRPGVKFNTGNEMTADDVVFSYNRLKNVAGNPSFLFTDFFESVTAVDPTTVELKLLAPNAALPSILSSTNFGVMDSKVAQEHGGSAAEDAAETDTLTDWLNEGNSIGTGPYSLTQWDISNEIIIEKNPDYWGEPVSFEKIVFRNVADTSTQLQLLETGEADLAFAVDPDKIAQVQANQGLQLLEGASLAHEYLAMNTTAEVGGPLASKEARQAIASAIDYDGIINGLLGGHAVRPATVVTLGLLGADEVEDKKYVTDIAKANELWAASGNGPTELTLTYGAGQTAPGGLSRDILSAKLQEDLQKIDGVTVTLNPMDPTERLQAYREGKLQFTMSDWAPDYADVHAYADPFGRGGSAAAKRVGYDDPAVTALLDAGIAEGDPATRLEDYVAIQEALIDAAAFVVEFQPNYIMPASKAVQGAQPHGTYILQLRNASKSA